jgi:hypothetical protein
MRLRLQLRRPCSPTLHPTPHTTTVTLMHTRAQEELEHQREQVAALEALVRERGAALAEARDRAAAAGGEREAGAATLRDLAARHSGVLAGKQVGPGGRGWGEGAGPAGLRPG